MKTKNYSGALNLYSTVTVAVLLVALLITKRISTLACYSVLLFFFSCIEQMQGPQQIQGPEQTRAKKISLWDIKSFLGQYAQGKYIFSKTAVRPGGCIATTVTQQGDRILLTQCKNSPLIQYNTNTMHTRLCDFHTENPDIIEYANVGSVSSAGAGIADFRRFIYLTKGAESAILKKILSDKGSTGYEHQSPSCRELITSNVLRKVTDIINANNKISAIIDANDRMSTASDLDDGTAAFGNTHHITPSVLDINPNLFVSRHTNVPYTIRSQLDRFRQPRTKLGIFADQN